LEVEEDAEREGEVLLVCCAESGAETEAEAESVAVSMMSGRLKSMSRGQGKQRDHLRMFAMGPFFV
jgi:hypothetical protein